MYCLRWWQPCPCLVPWSEPLHPVKTADTYTRQVSAGALLPELLQGWQKGLSRSTSPGAGKQYGRVFSFFRELISDKLSHCVKPHPYWTIPSMKLTMKQTRVLTELVLLLCPTCMYSAHSSSLPHISNCSGEEMPGDTRTKYTTVGVFLIKWNWDTTPCQSELWEIFLLKKKIVSRCSFIHASTGNTIASRKAVLFSKRRWGHAVSGLIDFPFKKKW